MYELRSAQWQDVRAGRERGADVGFWREVEEGAPMRKRKQSVEGEVRALFRTHYRLASSGRVGGENRITAVAGDEPEATAESEKVWHRKHAWSGTNLEVRITIS